MIKLLLILISFIFSFASEIYVAAAANTTYAMPEIIKKFNQKYPDVKVNVILASSGKLTAQIMHGAEYDVFMAANMKYPEFLYKKGIAKSKPKIYAKGAIALFSVKNIKLDNFKKALLNAKSIAIANPKTAPYGRAAVEAMKNAGIYGNVKNRLIFAETVSAVIPYTVNSADIGIVAKSSLFSPKMKKYKNFADVPKSLYKPINQGIIMLNNKKGTVKFYNFIFSDDAKEVFKKYGYIF
ncbi:molybdate ABC transporter substrate-binding protein [Nautilia sp. PV-1]|jgi:molybdate transport system substrate-binding protein|uniref:molybdate ABC transporter substrate-binding protein n=1 Tax=Nautilia sp. PV-1 TaxID=2579250 RepID=UPI000FD82C63|nr:molybdate ABC transporter substrate-binding protein [Nautilia sp. PV-1]AZV45886.1 molybdate ABC transporter substrate-binding protein [Nautilia sp. PV-1]